MSCVNILKLIFSKKHGAFVNSRIEGIRKCGRDLKGKVKKVGRDLDVIKKGKEGSLEGPFVSRLDDLGRVMGGIVREENQGLMGKC